MLAMTRFLFSLPSANSAFVEQPRPQAPAHTASSHHIPGSGGLYLPPRHTHTGDRGLRKLSPGLLSSGTVICDMFMRRFLSGLFTDRESPLWDRWCPHLLRGHPLSRVPPQSGGGSRAPHKAGQAQPRARRRRERHTVSSGCNATSPILQISEFSQAIISNYAFTSIRIMRLMKC